MGKYVGRITGLFNSNQENVTLSGYTFPVNKESKKEFKKWWRMVNIEHFLVFFLLGAVTIVLLSFLAYSTTYSLNGNFKDIEFLFFEASAINDKAGIIFSTLFLLICAFTLFGTQLTVMDATSRILAETSILTLSKKLKEKNIPQIYFIFLWLQIIAGIIIFYINFGQPLQLLIIAAVLNAFAMFVHTGLSLWTNLTLLEKEFRPSIFRVLLLIGIFLTYGTFSCYTIYIEVMKLI
jgi:cell division protein FtsL